MSLEIDPRWLINSVTIKRFGEKDSWGKREVSSITKVDHVRVDFGPQYGGTDNSKSLTANGVVFLYRQFSIPFPELDVENDLNDELLIDDLTKTYLIKQIIPIQDTDTKELFGYELEVL